MTHERLTWPLAYADRSVAGEQILSLNTQRQVSRKSLPCTVRVVPVAWREVRQDPCLPPLTGTWELKKRCEPKTEKANSQFSSTGSAFEHRLPGLAKLHQQAAHVFDAQWILCKVKLGCCRVVRVDPCDF